MKKQLLTTLALLAVSGMAWAGSGKVSFQELDANSDGQISRDEAKKSPSVKNNFDQADANRDGNLDIAEFAALETLEAMPKDSK